MSKRMLRGLDVDLTDLDMEGSSQLVATLSLDGFIVCAMESMQGKVLHLGVILVGQDHDPNSTVGENGNLL